MHKYKYSALDGRGRGSTGGPLISTGSRNSDEETYRAG